MKFRDLTANDIDVRIGQVGDSWFTLLLYKDARCDMNILDETVGAGGWQRKHYECKGNLFCSVGIKVGEEWLWKDDCGTESNTEKEKGESSDAFKRACVNWGIGRELYTAPRVVIKDVIENKKPINYRSFFVDSIKIENKVITSLKIGAFDKRTNSWVTIYCTKKND